MKPEIREMPTSELKSSFPCTFGYKPWLIQQDASNKRGQVFVDPFTATSTIKKIKSLEMKICLGSYQEWLLLVNVSTNEPFLFSPISNTEVRLPILLEQLKFLGGFVLSSEPTSPKCTIVVASKGQKFIIHCRPNGSHWIKVPFHKLSTNIVGQIVISKEKLYILARNYYNIILLVINMDSLPSGMTEYTIMRGPNGYCHTSRAENDSDHLVVSGENILLVSFYSYFKEVTKVETHLLETSDISWNNTYEYDAIWRRAEISDRRIFFFSKDYNMSFVPNHADMQLNCMYLLQSEHFGEKVHKINLDDQTVSSFILPRRFMTEWNRACWVIPSRARTRKEKSVSCKKKFFSEGRNIMKKGCTITSNISRTWTDLPIDLVQLLLPHLGFADCIRLPAVCKAWSDLSNPVLEAKIWPLLMYFSSDCNTCRLFDPICNQEYSLDMKWFTHGEKCALHFSKDGWVLLSREQRTYVVNPFTRETIDVPYFHSNFQSSFSFYSLPTSEDFMILNTWGDHKRCPEGVYLWWHGQTRWTSARAPEDDFTLHMGWTNPVCFEEEFYCLGRRGDLGVINPHDDDTTWEIFETTVHSDTPAVGTEDCYLLELDGELISVFRERTKREVQVFMLDHDEWAWNKQEDLGDLTLFLDQRGSVAKKLKLGGCYANRIYFSSFDVDGDRKVGAYYSICGACYHPRFDNLEKPINCVWIEPNLSVSKDLEWPRVNRVGSF